MVPRRPIAVRSQYGTGEAGLERGKLQGAGERLFSTGDLASMLVAGGITGYQNREVVELQLRSCSGVTTRPGGSVGKGRRLVIEQEFLGVDQSPNDVFIRSLGVLGVFFQVGDRD